MRGERATVLLPALALALAGCSVVPGHNSAAATDWTEADVVAIHHAMLTGQLTARQLVDECRCGRLGGTRHCRARHERE